MIRLFLYALAAVLVVPFLVGLVIGMCVPLAIGPVRRRLMAHAEAIRSTEKRLDAAADPGKIIMDPWYRTAQAALRDAKRRYDFPPDAGGES
jgi:hypothetical protein